MSAVNISSDLTPKARLALTAILAIYGVLVILSPGHYGIIDSIDLAIHEAGHVFFGPFGEFVGFLGGTLFQLIVPITFFGYFVHRGNRYAGSVLLWWLAQNLWNISVYVKDARALELPLVGGGEHDWAYLLGELGLLHRDQGIGDAIFATGVLIFIVSIALGFLRASDKPNESERGQHGVS